MAASKKIKKVPPQAIPSKGKVREGVDPRTFYALKPSWRFSLRDQGKWALFDNSDAFFSEILPFMQNLEGQTWASILVDAGKNNHAISVDTLNKVARDRMEELKLEYDVLYSLRITGTHRLYGIMDLGAFYILWYDTEHGDNDKCVCRSYLKHT